MKKTTTTTMTMTTTTTTMTTIQLYQTSNGVVLLCFALRGNRLDVSFAAVSIPQVRFKMWRAHTVVVPGSVRARSVNRPIPSLVLTEVLPSIEPPDNPPIRTSISRLCTSRSPSGLITSSSANCMQFSQNVSSTSLLRMAAMPVLIKHLAGSGRQGEPRLQ